MFYLLQTLFLRFRVRARFWVFKGKRHIYWAFRRLFFVRLVRGWWKLFTESNGFMLARYARRLANLTFLEVDWEAYTKSLITIAYMAAKYATREALRWMWISYWASRITK